MKSSKVAGHARGQRPIADQNAELDVAVEGGVGEVCRGHEDGLAVRDHRLGMEHAGRAVEIERTGVVVDIGSRFAGPVGGPEAIGEAAHELVRGGGVAPSSLDVQQQRDLEFGHCVHSARQDGEGPRPIKVDVCACPNRAPRGAQQLLVHPPRIACVQPRHLGTGPHQIGGGRASARLLDGSQPRGGGSPRDPHSFQCVQVREQFLGPVTQPETERSVAAEDEAETRPVSRARSSRRHRCGGRPTRTSVTAVRGRRRRRRARAPAPPAHDRGSRFASRTRFRR